MKHGRKMLVWVAGSLAFCTVANAVTPDSQENPYQSIIDRNVFSLKPPPPPPDPTEANKPQTVKITLTGITTILGNKRVLMKTAPPPAKPGEGPKTEQSYILTEGQREGDIEVISIDEKAGSVKVNNGGTVQTLTFEKDGAKLPAAAAPPGFPGGAPMPGAAPAFRGIPQPPGAMPTPNFQLPSRIPRLPTSGSPGGMQRGGMQPTGVSMGGAGFGMPGQTTQTPVPGSQISPEEQAILIEAARQTGAPGASLLPPTPLSPRANLGEAPAQGNPGGSLVLPPLPGRAPGLPGPY